MKLSKHIILTLLITFSFAGQTCARDSTLLDKIEKQISLDRIFEPTLSFRVHQFGSEIVVSTYKHPLAIKKDLKIDALLITHSIFKVTKNSVSVVKVYFFDTNDNSSYYLASIQNKLLNQLKQNTFNKDNVINQVLLTHSKMPNPLKELKSSTYKEITSGYSVSDGILSKERQNLFTRIKNLKDKGVDVSSLEKVFLKMDDLVRVGSRDIKPIYLYTITLLEAKERKRISILELGN